MGGNFVRGTAVETQAFLNWYSTPKRPLAENEWLPVIGLKKKGIERTVVAV
jgi:hypothetical protein